MNEDRLNRKWRPYLMIVFISILIDHHKLSKYLVAVLPDLNVLPLTEMFYLSFGAITGLYVHGRTMEKLKR
jgi:hypothetical protein